MHRPQYQWLPWPRESASRDCLVGSINKLIIPLEAYDIDTATMRFNRLWSGWLWMSRRRRLPVLLQWPVGGDAYRIQVKHWFAETRD